MKLSDFTAKQWRVLLILMLVNFVNYVDRQIVFALFPSIRRDFSLSFVQLSYLATAFTVVLSLASFPLGMLADRICFGAGRRCSAGWPGRSARY
jgi:MFS family permease